MTSIWVESLGRNFQDGLDLLEAAMRDCTDELWQANMWEVPDDDPGAEVRDAEGTLVTDPAARHALVQRHGTPWGVAWHALEGLDFKLTGQGTVPWEIWPRFEGRTGADITTVPSPWSRDDLLGYAQYCRQRVVDTLGEFTDETGATLLTRKGKPYASILMGIPLHVVEHASQIRQFITN